MVSGSISLPSRGSFHLSLTVLITIGHQVVFSLTGWSPLIHTRFLVSRTTLDSTNFCSFFIYWTFTLYGMLFQNISTKITDSIKVVLTPVVLLPRVWALPISLATTLGIEFSFFSCGY